jgi:hypothetical protein
MKPRRPGITAFIELIHATRSRADAVHHTDIIVEVVASDGPGHWNGSEPDMGKHQILLVACPDRAHNHSSPGNSAVPKCCCERRGSGSQLRAWTTIRTVCGMHDPTPDLDSV